jgi:hypothetical protein
MSKLIAHIEMRLHERKRFTEMFASAGYQHAALDEIQNRYHNSYAAPPWFAVTTELGFFIIGWRKHVIHIEWSDITTPSTLFDDLGNITRGPEHVHAYGWEKAAEYLARIRENATLDNAQSHDWPRSPSEFKIAHRSLVRCLPEMVDGFIEAEIEAMKKSEY